MEIKKLNRTARAARIRRLQNDLLVAGRAKQVFEQNDEDAGFLIYYTNNYVIGKIIHEIRELRGWLPVLPNPEIS